MPGQTRTHYIRGCIRATPSMEGRTIARPDDLDPVETARLSRPSMEGRTIARPDSLIPASRATTRSNLQWRAGQLPGQTAMMAAGTTAQHSFNGGPDNCPARPPNSRA